jgi:hypothetical protein
MQNPFASRSFARGTGLGSRRGPNDSEGYGIARLASDTALRASVRIGRGRERQPGRIGAGTGARKARLFAEDEISRMGSSVIGPKMKVWHHVRWMRFRVVADRLCYL